MNSASQKGCNLLLLGDRLIDRLNDQDKALKSSLAQLMQNQGTLNYCVVHEFLQNSANETFMLLESIQSVINDIDEPSISEELSLIRKELEALQAEEDRLERELRPYLFCPALNRPETSN